MHSSVGNKLAVEFHDMGEHLLKNIADPVQSFRVELEKDSAPSASNVEAIFRRPAVAVFPFENMSGDPE